MMATGSFPVSMTHRLKPTGQNFGGTHSFLNARFSPQGNYFSVNILYELRHTSEETKKYIKPSQDTSSVLFMHRFVNRRHNGEVSLSDSRWLLAEPLFSLSSGNIVNKAVFNNDWGDFLPSRKPLPGVHTTNILCVDALGRSHISKLMALRRSCGWEGWLGGSGWNMRWTRVGNQQGWGEMGRYRRLPNSTITMGAKGAKMNLSAAGRSITRTVGDPTFWWDFLGKEMLAMNIAAENNVS